MLNSEFSTIPIRKNRAAFLSDENWEFRIEHKSDSNLAKCINHQSIFSSHPELSSDLTRR